jgi:hypothetical protein
MPDRDLLLHATGVAAAVAAGLLLLCSWPWRSRERTPAAVGWVLGIGMGFLVGCWMLGARPKFPPREDLDRFLLVLIPLAILIELIAALQNVPRSIIWILRSGLTAGAARILLHDSIYLTDLAGPGTSEWTDDEARQVLSGLAAALLLLWVVLDLLRWKAPGRALPLALALACAGAAGTVILSGYASGGLLGLPLAASLTGATLASCLLARPSGVSGSPGVGVVGLFGLLVSGRFFGYLTTPHAVLLFAASLLCWLPELPYVRRLRPWIRGILRIALVALPVTFVVLQAYQRFQEKSQQPSQPGDTLDQDYL